MASRFCYEFWASFLFSSTVYQTGESGHNQGEKFGKLVQVCAKTAAFYGPNCFNWAKSCNKTQPASIVYAYANIAVFVFFRLDK